MEDYRLPRSAVAALKSLQLSGFPEVTFTEGKDTVQLKLTWTKRQPKQVKRAESGRGADCRRSSTSKPAPSAGESTRQPGQSGAESRSKPAPPKAKEVSLPKPVFPTIAQPPPSPRQGTPPRPPRKRLTLNRPPSHRPAPTPAPEPTSSSPAKKSPAKSKPEKPPAKPSRQEPTTAAPTTPWEQVTYSQMEESPVQSWVVDKPKYQDMPDGTRREYVKLFSKSGDSRPAYLLYDQAYSVRGEWYFLGTPGTLEYNQTATNWKASRFYRGLPLLQANERLYEATVHMVTSTAPGSSEPPIQP